MKQIIRTSLKIGLILTSLVIQSQVLQPAQWHVQVATSKAHVGDVVEVIFKVDIDDAWHLYSNIQTYDMGPMPAEFSFEPHESYERVGDVVPIRPKKEYDSVFEVDVRYFEHQAEFRQKIKILKDNPTIKGRYIFQVCSSGDGMCIPGGGEFNVSNKVVIKGATTKILGPSSIMTLKKDEEAEASMEVLAEETQETNLTEPKTEPVASITVLDTNQGASNTGSLWAFMLLAFGSGLAALLTPCVFPMIPLTVSFFGSKPNASRINGVIHQKQGRRGGFIKALLYGGFIILIYVIAGTLVAKINGPEFANWLSTHWLPNLLFFIIFIIFAMSFLGMFELTLPHSWINKMDSLSNQGGLLGVFFMAFTLVLISFSCTGPIVGSVLVLSAGGAIIKPIAGMFAFSLALALPFTLFAVFPKWLEKLPKSGGWLQEVKVILGFLELALALKFLSVADQVYHWGVLNREIYLALWIVIFSLLGFYLLGKLRLPYHEEQKTTSIPKLLLAVLVFGFVVYLIPGMIGAPLKPLSGYLPPLTSQEFVLQEQRTSLDDKRNGQTLTPDGCPEPKYADMLHLPHGLHGYFDLEQAKACAKAQNKPLFIDFTGHGCVNCRAMEARVWSEPNVLKLLNESYVVVALYVDEKTELPESDWYLSPYDGKMKTSIGKQNADYQITRFNNNAQPFYVLMHSEGTPLMPPKTYDLNSNHFVAFLEQGLQEYKNINNHDI